MNNLRRRGQSLCDLKDADENIKEHVQRTVKDTEEQWKALLSDALQIKASAEAQVNQETKTRTLMVREARFISRLLKIKIIGNAYLKHKKIYFRNVMITMFIR